MRRLAMALTILLALATAWPAGQTGKHFLWAVRHPGAPVTYLMGSLHVLTPEYYPLSSVVERAFAESTVLIQEVDLDEVANPATALAMLGKAMLTDGRTLDEMIEPSLYRDVVARAEKAGLPGAAVRLMKPWMVAVSLTGPALKQAGFKAELGVDKHFYDRARDRGLERRALETVAYQLARLDEMPMPLQEKMLKAAMADLDTQLGNIREMADAWAAGDLETLESDLLAAFREAPEIYERMLAERNRNWIAPVETCFHEKTACFVVVGAAHLVGPDSLVSLLRKKGYTVEQQ